MKNTILKLVAVPLVLLLFLFPHKGKSQTDSLLRHQIGINANKVFNILFKNQSYSAAISYNFAFNSKSFLRLGTNYKQSTGDEGEMEAFAKLGFHRVVKRYKKLEVYTGMDLIGGYNQSEPTQEVAGFGGVAPFFGLAILFSQHFSISTEPKFYTILSANTDRDSFDQTVYSKYYFGLTNIGQVQVRLSF